MATLLKHKHDVYADLEKIKAGLSDTGIGIKNLLGDSYLHSINNVKETTVNYSENVQDFIAENPFKSIGASVVTGIVIGFLLRRR